MKKFILGLLCGVLIAVPASTFAAAQLAAYLYPSKVTIHQPTGNTNFNAQDSPFLNYNNRIYVPLRAFSEAMGYYVNFAPASNENGNLNQIDIYSLEELEPIQDVEGYISMYVTGIEPSAYYSNVYEASGIVKANKDFTGKYIEFGSGINIAGELFSPLQKGQPRQFSAITTSGSFSDILKDQSLSVKSLWGKPEKINHTVVGLGPYEDMALRFLGTGSDESLSSQHRQNDMVLIYNNTQKDMILQPLTLTYEIVHVENGQDKTICQYPLPVPEGLLPADNCIGYLIPPWDYKDKDGKPVSPGTYAVKLITPEYFEFSDAETGKADAFFISKDFIADRMEFNILQ